MTLLRLATRGSTLALWQAQHVAALLRAQHPDVTVELVLVQTTGDLRADVPLHLIGGQGVFVKEVQQALLDGRADLAVHSAKDLPSAPAAGLVIGAVPERGDARDALVGRTLDELAPGSVVATGSVRRRAQLALARPDLVFADLRGNIGTRLERIPEGGSIVVAVAALERLGLQDCVAQVLPVERMVPQVGQGALAVECRADDLAARELLSAIEHLPSRRQVDVERAFLSAFGGGCDVPIGAHVQGRVLRTFATSDDGERVSREMHPLSADDPVASGRRAGEAVAAFVRP
ncbi:MAG TPA: hydroxymethylbilane synthase [Acidimicrobiales bacterium]